VLKGVWERTQEVLDLLGKTEMSTQDKEARKAGDEKEK
jgi:hypothetical protein